MEGAMNPLSCIYIVVQRQILYKMVYISLTYTIEKNKKIFGSGLSILLIFKSLGEPLTSEIKE